MYRHRFKGRSVEFDALALDMINVGSAFVSGIVGNLSLAIDVLQASVPMPAVSYEKKSLERAKTARIFHVYGKLCVHLQRFYEPDSTLQATHCIFGHY